MKTKFTFKAYLLPIVLIAILCVIIFVIPDFFISPEYNDKVFVKIFVPTIMISTFMLLFFLEFRTKCTTVEFNDKEIIVKQIFGLITKKYLISEIDGWKYSHQSDNGGIYEFIFLYSKNSKVVNVSQSYHRNYLKLKDYIQNNFNHLGYEKFSYISDFKEIFK